MSLSPTPSSAAGLSLDLPPGLPLGLFLAGLLSLLCVDPAGAQVETFINKPGSNVGPATRVVPTNCVKGPDGSLTCDTELQNPPSNTPAKPLFSPFKN
jgi:hypothetical protein